MHLKELRLLHKVQNVSTGIDLQNIQIKTNTSAVELNENEYSTQNAILLENTKLNSSNISSISNNKTTADTNGDKTAFLKFLKESRLKNKQAKSVVFVDDSSLANKDAPSTQKGILYFIK